MSQSHKLSSSGEFSIINCYLARKCNILNLILKKPIKFNFHNEAINNEIQCYCYGHLLSFKKEIFKVEKNFHECHWKLTIN